VDRSAGVSAVGNVTGSDFTPRNTNEASQAGSPTSSAGSPSARSSAGRRGRRVVVASKGRLPRRFDGPRGRAYAEGNGCVRPRPAIARRG